MTILPSSSFPPPAFLSKIPLLFLTHTFHHSVHKVLFYLFPFLKKFRLLVRATAFPYDLEAVHCTMLSASEDIIPLTLQLAAHQKTPPYSLLPILEGVSATVSGADTKKLHKARLILSRYCFIDPGMMRGMLWLPNAIPVPWLCKKAAAA